MDKIKNMYIFEKDQWQKLEKEDSLIWICSFLKSLNDRITVLEENNKNITPTIIDMSKYKWDQTIEAKDKIQEHIEEYTTELQSSDGSPIIHIENININNKTDIKQLGEQILKELKRMGK